MTTNRLLVLLVSDASSLSSMVGEVVDNEMLSFDCYSKTTEFVSLSADNFARVNSQDASSAPFIGIGKMERSNWIPKSRYNIKKTRYYGINDDFGFHLFKVWYVDLMEFEWKYRDYEE